jgi:hypothetical protein
MMTLPEADELEVRIKRLIAAEQYPLAQDLLRRYADIVVEGCIGSGAESRFLQAREFLRTSIEIVRSQRAHMARQLNQVQHSRAYRAAQAGAHTVDFSG